jgi:hypothetical protein
MSLEVTVRISPPSDNDGAPCNWIAEQFVGLGWRIVEWQPSMRGKPARATFAFDSEADRAKFLAAAEREPRS